MDWYRLLSMKRRRPVQPRQSRFVGLQGLAESTEISVFSHLQLPFERPDRRGFGGRAVIVEEVFPIDDARLE